MDLVATGMLNKQVGERLGVAEKTVKAHRSRAMQKMAASSVAELVRMLSRLVPEASANLTEGKGQRAETKGQ